MASSFIPPSSSLLAEKGADTFSNMPFSKGSFNGLSSNSPFSGKQESYTDLSSLKKINQMADTDKGAALKALSKQFESIFINLMLKTMRDSNAVFAQDGLFNSSEMQFHRESFDNQLALTLSNQGGIGLADAFYRQMHKQYEAADAKIEATKTEQAKYDIAEALSSSNVKNSKGDNDSQGSDTESKNLASINDLTPYFNRPYPVALNRSEMRSAMNDDCDHAIQNTRTDNKTLENTTNEIIPPFDDYFTSPEKFVESLYPYAKKASEKLGVDPKVLVAQAALETGWGKHVISDRKGASSHNIFNIKADSSWQGDHVSVKTIEFHQGIAKRESANFRHYNSLVDSFNDYVAFISQQPRYQQALEASTPEDYVHSLQKAGYATDPQYANKIMTIYHGKTVQAAER